MLTIQGYIAIFCLIFIVYGICVEIVDEIRYRREKRREEHLRRRKIAREAAIRKGEILASRIK